MRVFGSTAINRGVGAIPCGCPFWAGARPAPTSPYHDLMWSYPRILSMPLIPERRLTFEKDTE